MTTFNLTRRRTAAATTSVTARYAHHRPGQTPKDGVTETIVRYARQDQFPPGTNLRDAARDSVIRYALHYGLQFRWSHDQGGELWRSVGEPTLAPTGISMWFSEAIVVPHAIAPVAYATDEPIEVTA